LRRPILGFMIKDRLGQALFADNTYISYQRQPVLVPAGATFAARFTFRMPVMPTGDYVIGASVADGTQEENVQLQWLHEALHFKSHSSSIHTGLVGVPMQEISMRVVAQGGS
jgi:lipopolysaccharide transport system ATP-binding protein